MKNNIKYFYYIFIIFVFTGCQNLFENNVGEEQTKKGLNSVMINFIDYAYPLLGLLGVIILASSINNLFIKNIKTKKTIFLAILEFFVAVIFILSKNIIYNIFS